MLAVARIKLPVLACVIPPWPVGAAKFAVLPSVTVSVLANANVAPLAMVIAALLLIEPTVPPALEFEAYRH